MATAIGIIIGMVPGAGATVSAWIGYNVAKVNSKHPELFGKGAIEGVIGPECANDSCEGGSLIPTMTLGIPGSAGAAIILGGMTLAGMRPGPDLFADQAPQAIATMLSFTLAHIVFLGVAVWSMRYVIRVLRIPTLAWPPFIIAFAAFGAFIIQGRVFGIYAALAVGIAGYFLVQRGYPLPPMLLGFVLGPILEHNYVRVTLVSRGDIFHYTLGRPIALVFFALAILAVGLDVYQRRLVRQRLALASI
jgi:putative tricarboxylic transport membrane protein